MNRNISNSNSEKQPEHLKGVKRFTKSPRKNNILTKVLWLMIVVFMMAAIVLVIIESSLNSGNSSQNYQNQKQNRQDALQALSANQQFALPSVRRIVSSLGFSLEFDSSLMKGRAQITDASSTSTNITGREFDGADLNETRPYSIMKFEFPKDAYENYLDEMQLTMLTNIRNTFWDEKVNEGESKINALVRYASKNYTSDNGWQLTSTETVQIGKYEFKKIIFTQTTKYDKLEVKNSVHVYVTVQNDRPYIASIYNIRDSNTDKLSFFESVLNTVSFDNFNAKDLSKSESKNKDLEIRLASNNLDADLTNTPFGVSDETVFNVVLKNQPAVVRVSTTRCANVTVKSSNSTTIGTFKDACYAALGSGSIVSSDGYVATNGHVVEITNKNLLEGYVLLSPSVTEAKNRIIKLLEIAVSLGNLSQSNLNILVKKYDNQTIGYQQLLNAAIESIPSSSITLSED